MSKKKIVICDYPNPKNYTFPSFGFGSSEKRVWQIAKSFSEMDDFEAIITGPLWLHEYIPKAKYFVKRLDESTADEFVCEFGKVDYLFAGHEYFGNPKYDQAFLRVANKLMSYLLHPYNFDGVVFDGKKKHLFCYSDEMVEKYKEQSPHKLLLFHSGVGELPIFTKYPKNYLVWMGRIDTDKSPHYAIMAAEKVGIPLYILGKSVYQPEYEDKYKILLESQNVKRCGVVFGDEKMRYLSNALCGVYTLGSDYSEAGAGSLGEILKSGVPVAGITWKGNDAVCAAIDDPRLGKIVRVDKNMSDDIIATRLAESIKCCIELDRTKIFELASYKFDPDRLAREMINIVNHSPIR